MVFEFKKINFVPMDLKDDNLFVIAVKNFISSAIQMKYLFEN